MNSCMGLSNRDSRSNGHKLNPNLHLGGEGFPVVETSCKYNINRIIYGSSSQLC
jgi:hypothetical protein